MSSPNATLSLTATPSPGAIPSPAATPFPESENVSLDVAIYEVSRTSLSLTLSFAIVGFVISISLYIISTKGFCCAKESLLDKIVTKWKGEKSDTGSDSEEHLCGSQTLINFVAAIHFLSLPIVIGVNIYYLVENFDSRPPRAKDFVTSDLLALQLNTSNPRALGLYIADLLSDVAVFWETGVLIAAMFVGFCFVPLCMVRQKDRAFSCRELCEFVRGADLLIALIVAPFSHTYFFILGGKWYIIMAVRLGFYSLTFAAAVISGIRCLCGSFCLICFECSNATHGVEIRNWGHLIGVIIAKLVPISLKLLTCSSALSTYLTLGILQPFPVRVSYFAFSVVRGATALFSLGFSAIFLRWTLLEEESKEDSGCYNSLARWLDDYQAHVHLAFFFDAAAYGGLIVLNSYILHNYTV